MVNAHQGELPPKLLRFMRRCKAVCRNFYGFGEVPELGMCRCGWCDRRLLHAEIYEPFCSSPKPEEKGKDSLCFMYRCTHCTWRQEESVFSDCWQEVSTEETQGGTEEEVLGPAQLLQFSHPLLPSWRWSREEGWTQQPGRHAAHPSRIGGEAAPAGRQWRLRSRSPRMQ